MLGEAFVHASRNFNASIVEVRMSPLGSGIVKKPDQVSNRRLGVLISGRGSNLQAIIDAIAERRLDATIALVVSNQENAAGLERARRAGIETLTMSHRGWVSREDYDRALVNELRKRDVALVCLAGFMRLFSSVMLEAFPNAILNIHPSLLPSFPGLHPHQQALDHGVRVSGVTVHFVTADLDAGPIIVQRTVRVRDDDTEETLSARILVEEHIAYPEAIALVLGGGWRIEGRRVIRSKTAAAV
jgi:phosphoribosylglycinamide formyltransferase-1